MLLNFFDFQTTWLNDKSITYFSKLLISFPDYLAVTQSDVKLQFYSIWGLRTKNWKWPNNSKMTFWWWDSNGSKTINIIIPSYLLIGIWKRPNKSCKHFLSGDSIDFFKTKTKSKQVPAWSTLNSRIWI